MIKNYLRIAFRTLLRNKLSAFINIFGLALAMACSMLIYVFITDELSYERYHANIYRIWRVTRNFRLPDGSVNLHLGHVAPPFGPLLKNDFPEFEVEETSKRFYEPDNYFAEPNVFNVFDIPVVSGNPDRALNEPMQLMPSETTAYKYFGAERPLGKSLRLGDTFNAAVSGVFKDFPDQSHWQPDLLVSFATLNDSTIYGRRALETNFGNNSFGTYILAKEPFDAEKMEAQFPAFVDRHINQPTHNSKASTSTKLFLPPISDIHLHSHLDSEEEVNGNLNNLYMIDVIGVFIVLIACFNFVNLSTARASKRAKEVGLRKVVGAQKQQLIWQYVSESVLIAIFALMVALVLCTPALLWLNEFTGKSLDINVLLIGRLMLVLVLFAAGVGLIAGIYPAFVLSGFKPALALKGQHGYASG